MKVTVRFNSNELTSGVEKAFASYSQLLEKQFTTEITTKQFEWPTKSSRGGYNKKSRETVGSPRDIVDSGAFRQSLIKQQVPGGYRFSWTVPYAAPILYGYRTKAGNVMPPRDFITPALTKLPVVPFMKRYLGI